MADPDYGLFTNLVSTAGTLMAAVGALGLAFRGRARWEPIEEDVPAGGRKVGGVVAAVAIAVMRATMFEVTQTHGLVLVAVLGAGAAIFGLLIYGGLIAGVAFERPKNGGGVEKVVGGLWVLPRIRALLQKANGPRSIQEAFASSSYRKDFIWPNLSIAVTKQCFVLSYLVLTVSGTVALASGAMLVDLIRKDGWSRPVVVLMDSYEPELVYSAERRKLHGSNADDLTEILKDLPIVLAKESTSLGWRREEQVLSMHPALIIMHLSAFFEHSHEKDADQRVHSFVRYMSSHGVRFVIYSRPPGAAESADLNGRWNALQADIHDPAVQPPVTFVPIVDSDEPWNDIRNRSRIHDAVSEKVGLAH